MIYTNFTRADGARRNLFTYSDEVGDSLGWLVTRFTRTANAITSPSGENNGVLFVDNLIGSSYLYRQNWTFEAGKTYTLSVYARYHLDANLGLGLPTTNGFAAGNGATFNLQNGTIVGGNVANSSIVHVGDGWYRCSTRATCVTTTTANWICFSSSLDVLGTGYYLWGGQLEENGLTAYQPVVSGLEFNTEPLNHARIVYENLALGITPTASSSAAGRPAIAATYPTTYEYWTPTTLPATWSVDLGSAKNVDSIGMVGDMLGCTVAIQYSTNNSTWVTVDTRTVVTDRINMFLFLSVSARYWRVSVSVQIPRISVIYIGTALAMQRPIYQGHTPLTLSRTTDLSNNVSEGGQYLGRSIIRTGAESSAAWSNLRADWYRANFDPFVRAARTAPFFFGWRPAQYPAELGFVWTDKDIAPDNSGPRNFMSVDVGFKGLINE